MIRALFLLVMLASAPAAIAIDKEGPLEDPALQARYEQLTWELRCLVCQNQNIADSNADLAKDLRKQVRARLLAGETDEQILNYMTDRYGDFVLYRPSLAPKNWLLWAAPVLLLGIGVWLMVGAVRRQVARGADESKPDETGNAS